VNLRLSQWMKYNQAFTMTDRASTLGAGGAEFPATSWSMVAAARDPSHPEYRENLQRLCSQYWKPVFWFFRFLRRSSVEEAKDLTQEFFVHLIEGSFLDRVQPTRGRFRAYLKASLRNFASDDYDKNQRLKRGGGIEIFSIDISDEERRPELPDPKGTSPEQELDRHWAKTLTEQGIESLKTSLGKEGLGSDFELFKIYYYPDVEERDSHTYASLAKKFGITPYDIANKLHRVRKIFKETIKNLIRDSVSSEQAAELEFDDLFGA